MAKASFVKTSWESWIVAADFNDDLESGEQILLASSAVTATDSDGTDATATVLDQTGKAVSEGQLQIRVTGGTDGEVYNIEYKAVTDLANKFELNVQMKIKG